jgi:hypothetical protein
MAMEQADHHQRQETGKSSIDVSVKWIVKGRTLMVQNRVLNVAKDCQVVFFPKRLKTLMRGDIEESVEFWFRYPVPGAIPCVPDQSNGVVTLKPADPTADRSKVSRAHQQWLIRFTGRTAREIRRLYRQL